MGGTSTGLRALRRTTVALAMLVAGSVVAVAPWGGAANAVACATGVGATNALGPATGWTEFVEGAGSRGSESEGAIAYGGSLPSGMTVGTRLPDGFPAGSPALVIGGTHGGYNLQKGSAYVTPQSSVNFNGGGHYLASNPIDFAAAFTQLRTLSAQWGSAPATGTVTTGVTGGNNALVLTGAGALNVFDLSPSDAAALAGGRHLGLSVPAGATTIINVPGTSPVIGGQAWLGSGSSWSQAADGNVKGAYAGLVWNFPDATTVTVSYGSAFPGTILAPNAAVTIASAGHTIGQIVAKTFASGYETHQNLFPGEACVPTPPSTPGASDVTIAKSASTATPQGGGVVTYTLKATNAGNLAAAGVAIRDELPAGVTFVSAQAPCAQAGGVVTCNVGTLAPGASVTKTVTVTADPIAGAGPSSDPQATHWLTPYKAEAQVDLEAGQQRTITLGCRSGDYLSDGQFRIDHVDQGTGTIRDVKVLSARSHGESTWKGVIRNDATGRAQAKAFVVCLPHQTEASGGHRHTLSVDTAVPSITQSYAVGRSSATLTCPTGTVPVAPGFDLSSAGAELVGSEHSSSSPRQWTFTLDVTAPVTATFTARCVRTNLDPVGGHTHELRFTHVVRTVTVAGHTAAVGDEHQVICPDDGKGVVATFDLPPGVHPFGNDPRLKARAFRLFNDTGSALSATVDLVCLRDRTGSERMGTPAPVEVVNTATVTSATADANATNNAASATITVQPGAATATIAGVRITRSKAAITVLSSMPGKGALRIKARGKVVAEGKVKLRAGRPAVAKVKLTRKAKRTLRHARAVRVIVDPSRGKAVAKTVRVRR